MNRPPIIQLEHIHKVYDTGSVPVHALRDVSLTVEAGEFAAIMGASGSGKSSLMNILGCLDRPTSGRYLLDGADVSHLSKDERASVRNSKIGFVFQGFNLLRRTSAMENVELPLIYSNVHAHDRHVRSRRALELVGLGNKLDSHPNQLSGGQQQRVAIARALVTGPSLILADEPTGNLDSRTAVEIMALFQRMNAAGITIVLVTHEPDIAQYCRRMLVVKDGRILLDQPVRNRRDAAAEMASAPPQDEFEEVLS
ncbi:MAG: ABC transporter ATP-binding protein [Bryobacterales bacterium]|nr:ABC transporter ATP-binding protein [Bryobacterales bacterium]